MSLEFISFKTHLNLDKCCSDYFYS